MINTISSFANSFKFIIHCNIKFTVKLSESYGILVILETKTGHFIIYTQLAVLEIIILT